MNALLRGAGVTIAGGAQEDFNEVFAFVSDSTIPVKPFRIVYGALVGESEGRLVSSFCATPPSQWSHCRTLGSDGGPELTVKHHQWIVLTREHASKSLRHEELLKNVTGRRSVGVNQWDLPGEVLLGPHSKCDLRGCLDEYWHFFAVFGALEPRMGKEILNGTERWYALENFMGNGLLVPNARHESRTVVAGSDSRIRDVQGMCWTYVYWGEAAAKSFRTTSQALKNHTTFDTEKMPAKFRNIDRQGITVLRQSPFLFARKFDDKNTQFDSAINHILFEDFAYTVDGRSAVKKANSDNIESMVLEDRKFLVS
eukprot:gnl/TRDRNA2_/TRDRNA2_163445_c0_seq1.p1 gnl/TRDRNA2_/TRDRNA2_163445_c0~~gnl/TRDRNA2_/TRDRNA2_163445_c0_seq1.p1  ORF type:complete len:355 (+),score=46.18 gnl/TRDRNA2_/TRDRNA2_163445_c0_seq1:132-1067(+)